MATTTSTVVVTERVCDYCDKPEAEVGFIQTYLMVPRRSYGKAGALFPKGARDIDLCAGCAILLAPRGHVNVTPTRPKLCRAKKEGVRCMLEAGHKSEHVTATAQHWGWLVLAA